MSVRFGRTTAAEKQLIRNNIQDLLVLTGISSAQELLFPDRYGERAKELKRLRPHNFMVRLGKQML